MGMRVCLDGRGNHFGGVYTYTYAILRALPEVSPDIEYVALLDTHQVREGRLAVPGMRVIETPVMSPLRMAGWNNWALPKLLEREKIDLYHGFKHFPLRYPRHHDCKMIWMLRTAAWWLFPELISTKERLFWTNYYQQGARRLDQSVCVAHADKAAFVEAVGADPDRVSVTQLAADERFQVVEDAAELVRVKEAHRLPDRFVLFVGTIYPFKNLETVLRVFAKVVQGGALDHHLVFAGGISPAYGESYQQSLKALARELGIHERLHWLGSVFEDLPAVYTLADALLFPSRFEAFPKPPLEAMACGTPVVTSTAGGLPEVVGDAGLLRAPDDVEGLSGALASVLTDPAVRSDLLTKGFQRARHFTWERCAQDTVDLYDRVLKPGN